VFACCCRAGSTGCRDRTGALGVCRGEHQPGSSTTGCPGDPPHQIYNPNSGGTPTTGGVLDVLGTSDVDDALDTNIGYTPIDSLAYMLYRAMSATSESQAASLWHQADVEVMSQAAVYPVADTNEATIHSSTVHHCVFIAAVRNCDLANVWLSS
jgi:hypothetical protein